MAENNQSELDLISMSDEFIKLANKLFIDNHQELWRVSAAIRFAAARFNAYEASFKSSDLASDREESVSWFTDEYRKMFAENLDYHIANNNGKI